MNFGLWVWILTRGELKKGECELVPYDPNIGYVWWKKMMVEEEFYIELEKYFHKSFYQMADRVEQLFVDDQERLNKKGKNKKKEKEEDAVSVNQ